MAFNIIGDRYYSASEPKVRIIEPGNYYLKFDEHKSVCYFEFISNSFTLPSKVYDISTEFNDRVVKSFQNSKGNLGVILNGSQGTGKSVSGKLICNELKLPVFILQYRIHQTYLTDLFNSLEQEFVVLIDEYEKIYTEYEDDLLTLLDGVTEPKNKFLLLCTCNELNVSVYLINRPSRIRYIKQFEFLKRNVIEEIVEDKLKYKKYYSRVIEVLTEYCFDLTVDNCISFVEEVNLYNEDPMKLIKYFNINNKFNSEILETVTKNNNRRISKAQAKIGFGGKSEINYEEIMDEASDSVDKSSAKIGICN